MTAVATPLPRSEVRRNFPPDIRFALAEEDLDAFEAVALGINTKLSRIMWFAAGSFISFLTSAVLLAIQLIGR